MDRRIGDCEWPYLASLRTLRAPAEGMPRLGDLLAWMAGPGGEDDDGAGRRERVWVLLDIKVREGTVLVDVAERGLTKGGACSSTTTRRP